MRATSDGTHAGARAQYERAMLEAFELEDVIKCRASKDYTTE